VGELDELLHKYLAQLQAGSPELIHARVDVEAEYSFRCSVRRGSTTRARNRGVGDGVIEANQRWKKEERAGRRDPALGMLETYTDAQAAIELRLEYSRAL
jgi:hypothetical protein